MGEHAKYGFDQQGWYGMFVACGIWCLAELTLETSAKHHIPQATNIPYQPCWSNPYLVCERLIAIDNLIWHWFSKYGFLGLSPLADPDLFVLCGWICFLRMAWFLNDLKFSGTEKNGRFSLKNVRFSKNREIFVAYRETVRFSWKSWVSRQNRETWEVCFFK